VTGGPLMVLSAWLPWRAVRAQIVMRGDNV